MSDDGDDDDDNYYDEFNYLISKRKDWNKLKKMKITLSYDSQPTNIPNESDYSAD